MLVRKIERFFQHHFAHSSKALLVVGAPQVGKTYSLRRFANTYGSFVYLNCRKMPKAASSIARAANFHELIKRLEHLDKHAATPHLQDSTRLIVFDDIHLRPELFKAVELLVNKGSCKCTISCFSSSLNLEQIRLAYGSFLESVNMYPLDFEEFLLSDGVAEEVINLLRHAWEHQSKVDDFIHKQIMLRLVNYLMVGGMPAAVKGFLSKEDVLEVIEVQKTIISKYYEALDEIDPYNKLRLKDILDLIAKELNAKNKRFFLNSLTKCPKFKRFEKSFSSLCNLNIAIAVPLVKELTCPLKSRVKPSMFKLYLSDVGLLASHYERVHLDLLLKERSIACSAVVENFVVQELVAHGFKPYFYQNKEHGVLDLLIEGQSEIVPIEVKVGKGYTVHRALANIMDKQEFKFSRALVFTEDNLHVDGAVTYAPVYMVMFLGSSWKD